MAKKRKNSKLPGGSLREIVSEVSDLLDSRSRRSYRGYVIAMVSLSALFFLVGREYFPSPTKQKQPANGPGTIGVPLVVEPPLQSANPMEASDPTPTPSPVAPPSMDQLILKEHVQPENTQERITQPATGSEFRSIFGEPLYDGQGRPIATMITEQSTRPALQTLAHDDRGERRIRVIAYPPDRLIAPQTTNGNLGGKNASRTARPVPWPVAETPVMQSGRKAHAAPPHVRPNLRETVETPTIRYERDYQSPPVATRPRLYATSTGQPRKETWPR